MTSAEIRRRFLTFFEKRGHKVIPSASLVTSDDKGVTNPTLFNTAGMQPLIPYLLGEKHPAGNRLVDSQKCLRTIDLDEVGDATHATFFEMLGNWSLGDYFKEEAIKWSYEFLTSKEEGLGLDPKRLYVTVFEGDKNSPKDLESVKVWEKVGVPINRIYFKGADSNWWPAVKGKDEWTGPTGPCSEMFYDITNEGLGDLSPAEFARADEEQEIVEIWNDVFMEFEKKEGKILGKLKQNNVDTGAGLERLTAVLQKVDNIYDTDLLKPVMDLMVKAPNSLKNKRIIADHLRASAFLIADGVIPSNTDRGYILRRLIRRAIVNTTDKKLDEGRISKYVDTLIGTYKEAYPDLENKSELIKKVVNEECSKFAKALDEGPKEFHRLVQGNDQTLDGAIAFKLFTSYGLPLEFILELAVQSTPIKTAPDLKEKFEALIQEHQALSRSGASQKFKGGLADSSDEQVVRYHTATHLLNQALHDVLGDSVSQKGSNITAERLRFDFAHGAKMTDEEKKKVEDIVNDKIKSGIPVNNVVMSKAEAEKTGARHQFNEKYGDEISIYFIGNDLNSAYSKEFCGGPHVKNTKELAGPEGKWRFKIQKEEAVSAGVRRIKAVLE